MHKPPRIPQSIHRLAQRTARWGPLAVLIAATAGPVWGESGQTPRASDPEGPDATIPADSDGAVNETDPSPEAASGSSGANQPRKSHAGNGRPQPEAPKQTSAPRANRREVALIKRLFAAHERGGSQAMAALVEQLPESQRAVGMRQVRLLRDRARARFGGDDHPLRPFIAEAFRVLNQRIMRDARGPRIKPIRNGGDSDRAGNGSSGGGQVVTSGGSANSGGSSGGGGPTGGAGGRGGGGGGGGGGGSGGSGGSGGGSSGGGGGSGNRVATTDASRSATGSAQTASGGTSGGDGGGTPGLGDFRDAPEADLFDAARVIAPDADEPTAPPYPIFLPDPQRMPYSHTDRPGNRVVSFMNIGGGSTDPALRMTRGHVRRLGWSGYIQQRLEDQLAWGVRRVQLHNPFGRTSLEGPMEADQYLLAREQGFDWLTEGFVEAWRPVVSGQYTDGEPVEVIAYFGTLLNSPTFQALEAEGKTEQWWARAWASIKPALDAGMSVGFDAVSFAPEDHPAHHFVRNLRDRGVRVYIETWPHKGFEHWAGFNVILSSRRFEFVQRSKKPLPRSLFGEMIQIIRPEYDDRTWLEQADWLKRHSAGMMSGDNQRPAIPVGVLDSADVSMGDLVDLSHHYGSWD